SSSLGDTSAGTRVFRGRLQLAEGGGREQIEVEQGRLDLGGTIPHEHNIFLKQGQLSGGAPAPGHAILIPTVHYTGGVVLGTSNGSSNLVLAGGLRGTGSVVFLDGTEVAGELFSRGNIINSRFDTSKISGKLSQMGDVFVADSVLELSGDVGSPNGVFHVVPDTDQFPGPFSELRVSHSNSIETVILDPRLTSRDVYLEEFNYVVSATDGAVLTITNELRFLGGKIRGSIAGQQVLTKRDRTPGLLEDIAGSEFEQIIVEGGALTLRGNVGDLPPGIRLGHHDTSRVIIENVGTYRGDIYLNNAQGDGDVGALSSSGDTTLAGNIYLGNRGSVVSNAINITGTIHGGELTVIGRGDTHLRSSRHSYTGATTVFSESLIIIDQGVLNSTSKIVGAGRLTGGGGNGGLILDNRGEAAHSNRIPDTTPIHLNGMKLTLIGRDGEQVSETLGTVHATRGMSEMVVQNSAAPNSQTTLLIEALNRQAGGVIRFDAENPNASIRFTDALALDNNLRGCWALVRGSNFAGGQDFATYGPNGVVAFSDLHTYADDLATASASDNVFLNAQGAITLSSNRNVNALKMSDSDVELNGHRLTIESGGLLLSRFADTIKRGQLTAGGAELIVSGRGNIEADIVDNSQGAVGLTYSSNGENLRLSGNNTFTGPTILNGGGGAAVVELLAETALPEGGDVTLNGALLYVAYDSETPLKLGRVELRDYAEIRGTSSNPPAIQPESLVVESGTITDLDLIGDAPITKTGLGSVFFGDSLANYSGPVVIDRGAVAIGIIGDAPLDDEHAVTIRSGGRMDLDRSSGISRKFRLDGGVVDIGRSGLTAPIEVLNNGGTVRGSTEISGAISGQGDLILEGDFGDGRFCCGQHVLTLNADLSSFEGDLLFTGGWSEIIGDNSSFAGSIDVTAGNLTAAGQNVFGIGQVTILPEGRLDVESLVTGDLLLAGGIVRMAADPFLNSPRLSGELAIAKHSYLFIEPLGSGRQLTPVITSELRLLDQANLNVAPDLAVARRVAANISGNFVTERLTLTGDLIVEGNATITSFDAHVQITGTIKPASEVATLNLVGNDTFDFRAAIQIEESKSLSIVVDGQTTPLSLSGQGANIQGNGTYVGDVSLHSSAAISPGDSAGLLTIDGNATLDTNSRFIVELGGTARGDQHDALDVLGNVSLFDSLLEVSLLGDFIPSPEDGFVILRATQIEGMFSNATESITVGGAQLPMTYRNNMVILGNVAVVPEPSTLALVLLGFTGLILVHRSREGHRDGTSDTSNRNP
ncbi:MAG: PEP-CTERM sorting domain-containing protein, partial [Aeoliella sp.]